EGYKSPYFCTDQENMVAELEDAYVLIHDDEISQVQNIVDILENVADQNKPLLIIADDVDGEALQTLVVNNLKGQIEVAAVEAPGFGDRQQQNLEDIAVLTGGEVITEEKGLTLDRVTLGQLGEAGKITVTEDDTTIVQGKGSQQAIQERVQQIERQIQNSDSDYDREKLQERLARLAGGVGVVKIGAATEPEMDEKKGRAEDALDATRAAIEEGIIPGGGATLLRVAEDLEDEDLEGEEAVGIDILQKALREPARQIANNSGKEGSVIAERILETDSDSTGFNAQTLEIEDLYESGIIDPAKVARSALQNAASIGKMFLTTEAAVVEKEDDEEDEGGAPAGGAGAGAAAPGAGGGMPGGGMGM
ncbi:MAG: chaperonin GroEL, partial [bacterium]